MAMVCGQQNDLVQAPIRFMEQPKWSDGNHSSVINRLLISGRVGRIVVAQHSDDSAAETEDTNCDL
jgi:hypothetical protein